MFFTFDKIFHNHHFISTDCNYHGGGGWRRGLGPRRNDVLTTCKVLTFRGGQTVIAVYFSQSKRFRGEKRTSRGNNSTLEKIISYVFVLLACSICPLVLKWQNVSDTHGNLVNC